MDRTLFPKVQLFKKEITERLLVASREIYRNHPTYTFADEEKDTKILLYPSYADIDAPGKLPKILFRVGGYQFGLNDTLFNNFEDEAKNSQGIISGYSHTKAMVTSFQAFVQAYAEEEASDLGDEFAMLTAYSCRTMFDQVGIKIHEVQVSPTELSDGTAGKYQTVLGVSIDFVWSGKTTQEAPKVDDVDLEGLEFDDQDVGGYRAPGLEVFRQRMKQLQP